MANLSINYSRLMDDVGYLVGWGLSANFTAEQTTLADRCVNDGYRVFLDAPYAPGRMHRWSFLEPRLEITLTAPYTTGTIGISSGVVTLDSGIFPSWADQGRISINGGTYLVDVRTDDTHVTLEDLSVNLTTGSNYSLERVTYDLPDNFGGWGAGPIVIESETLVGAKEIQRVSEAYVRRMWDYGQYATYPCMVAHFYETVADNNSNSFQRQVAEFWPPADQPYVCQGRYIVNPNELDDTNNTIPLGNQRYHSCLKAAVLAEAERTIMDGTSQVWQTRFQELLTTSVAWDIRTSEPRTYGMMATERRSDDFIRGEYRRTIPPGDIYTYP